MQDRPYEGNALFFLAMTQRELGQTETALGTVQQALDIAHEDGLVAWGAFWQLEMARIQVALGDPGQALVVAQQSAVIQRQIGDRTREAAAYVCAGEAYSALERPQDASKFLRMAIALYRESQDRWALAGALVHLARERVADGQQVEARTHINDAVELLDNFHDPRALNLRAEAHALIR